MSLASARLKPAYDAIKTLVNISGSQGVLYDAAGGALTNGRSSTATIEDFEGVIRNCKVGEIRYANARRVENLFGNTALAGTVGAVPTNWGTTGIGITSKVSSEPGVVNFRRIQGGFCGMQQSNRLVIGRSYRVRVGIRRVSGVTANDLSLFLASDPGTNTIASAATIAAQAVDQWVHYSSLFNATTKDISLMSTSGAAGQGYDLTQPMLEDVTGQLNQAPSEYIDSDVIYNAGVPGVKYLDYKNGNTVTGGVVTEAQGAPLAIAMLHEGVATNYVKSTTNYGAAVGILGSGGALPTGWGAGSVSGITIEVVALGTIKGQPCIDIRIYGTNNSGGLAYSDIYMCSGSDAVATVNEVWSGSGFTQLIAGSLINFVGGLKLAVLGFNSSGIYVESTTGSSVPPTSTMGFTSVTYTIVGASVAYARMALNTGVPAGASVDATIRIMGPQLERSPYPSSRIQTSGAAATRAADNVKIPHMLNANLLGKSGLMLMKFTYGVGLTDNDQGNGIFTIGAAITPIFKYGTSGGQIAYQDKNAAGITWDVITARNSVVFLAFYWSLREGFTLSASIDGGVWQHHTIQPFAGLPDGNFIELFRNSAFTHKIHFLKTYSDLPGKNLARARTWVENNAFAQV